MSASPTTNLPPLESSDRLTRQKIERRYRATPDLKKAELIEGVMYVSSRMRITHGRLHAQLLGRLGT